MYAPIVAATDEAILALLPALAVWLAVSGADDLILIALWAWFRLPGRSEMAPPDPATQPNRRIAVYLPLWQEAAVVRQMVTHNVSAIRYGNYHFFIGAYPNDPATVAAINDLASRFPHVHLALTPHDGPTSKADCLNWIYQRMLLQEETSGAPFDAIVTHDAEDLIHPDAFGWIDACLVEFDMVQVPVLPLPTSIAELVHGVYIDEFSEFQSRDLFVRSRTGGFLPAAGVGTAISRRALEALAASASNRIFEPGCLTEDYEIGFRVKTLGFRQTLLAARPAGARIVATREYFPRTWSGATRQRTRWATGIGWQGMERHGWQGGAKQWWWHWRDRKGLIGSPVSLLSNLLFLYGASGWTWATVNGGVWALGPRLAESTVAWTWPFLLGMALLQAGTRAAIVGRYYGWQHALLSPLRIPAANLINTVAALRATKRYWMSRWRGQPLVWLKTAHQYPNRFSLQSHRPDLEELLIRSEAYSRDRLDLAIRSKPAEIRLDEWLLEQGEVPEAALYEALSLHLGMDFESIQPESVAREASRALPLHLLLDLSVIPIRRVGNELLMATPELPPEAAQKLIEQYTRMPVRFALVTQSNFDCLCRVVLPQQSRSAAAG